ncbi:hypothetical protein [Wolbachia endosymbiont of Cruorifilaria tuberocauda]|uniref:hypothetical protein n=1 Tax=Wolbachia endosymbiont of Cruorifilaria tuberocauda TaxID=1812111 RepID=UPI00350EB2F3
MQDNSIRQTDLIRYSTQFFGYFISYYDCYQPEAYLPQTDTYIEKESIINERIDIYLLESRDTIIVASVSYIYGLGSPKNYQVVGIKFMSMIS